MKTLVLIRHGKSCWDNYLKDHNRPLKKRAYKDINLVAKSANGLLSQDFTLYSSTAVRAHETAKAYMKHFGIDASNLILDHELYTFDSKILKDFLFRLNDDINKVVFFGHNPAFTTLASQLGSIYFGNIPTSGLVKIEFDQISWHECKNGETTLHLFPKYLRK